MRRLRLLGRLGGRDARGAGGRCDGRKRTEHALASEAGPSPRTARLRIQDGVGRGPVCAHLVAAASAARGGFVGPFDLCQGAVPDALDMGQHAQIPSRAPSCGAKLAKVQPEDERGEYGAAQYSAASLENGIARIRGDGHHRRRRGEVRLRFASWRRRTALRPRVRRFAPARCDAGDGPLHPRAGQMPAKQKGGSVKVAHVAHGRSALASPGGALVCRRLRPL
mmetsp:Transcript_11170/g.38773  ORF Transcript_11170/g.38773 Transcript_11170/m.38773 type:complete len:223 (-) Transcript_11170:313-981(-)